MLSHRLIYRLVTILLLGSLLSSCYFFRKRQPGDAETTAGVVGASLGTRAGGEDAQGLALVHGTSASDAAAAIRPDPDLLVRNLLLQYRDQGELVAREIGRVEEYRLLLGGGSQDFSITPQKSYDATSLLAKLKVAEEICESLVAPSESRHPGWTTILPAAAVEAESNIRFLVQRLVGLPSGRIDDAMIQSLSAILETALDDGVIVYESYVPVCATLVVDAGSLLL